MGDPIPCTLLTLTGPAAMSEVPLVPTPFSPPAAWPAHTWLLAQLSISCSGAPPPCPALLLCHHSLSCDTLLSALLDPEELGAWVFLTLEFQRKHKAWHVAGAACTCEGTLTNACSQDSLPPGLCSSAPQPTDPSPAAKPLTPMVSPL